MNNNVVLGSVRTPIGMYGNWSIQEFSVSEDDAKLHNARCFIRGELEQQIEAGKYLRLRDPQGIVVMSNTPMEIESNLVALSYATGDVLVMGLGMGMVLEGLIAKPDVKSIKVIEIDQDIIDHIGVLYKDEPKVTILKGDCLQYIPEESEYYDYIWFDIWPDINEKNLDEMEILWRRFLRKCDYMNFWSLHMLTGDEDYFASI